MDYLTIIFFCAIIGNNYFKWDFMRRHNHLTDDVFKKCKYIATINRVFGFKDIRKEDNKQYKILLDIFQTFILVFNCFFSDSNKNKADKADEARTIIEKLDRL